MGSAERKTAVKATISTLLSGAYHHEEGWDLNYLELSQGTRYYRVNVIGVVVATLPEEDAYYLDDGTGTILVRNYTEQPLSLSTGDFVLVVGRVREGGGQRYLSSEITRKTDPSWVAFRKKELEKEPPLPTSSEIKTRESELPMTKTAITSHQENQEHLEKLLLTLKKDTGSGISIELLLSIGIPEAMLTNLLKDGTLYQPRPGYIKLVT